MSRHDDETLRRRCLARLQDLDLPDPFDLDVFRARLEASRGRQIHLHPVQRLTDSGPGIPCGVWIATDQADHIFYAPTASQTHRRHIILHELGHVICHHRPDQPLAATDLGRIFPHLSPGLVHLVLGRTGYTTPQEQEAEMIASLLGERVGDNTTRAARTAPTAVRDVVARIDRIMG